MIGSGALTLTKGSRCLLLNCWIWTVVFSTLVTICFMATCPQGLVQAWPARRSSSPERWPVLPVNCFLVVEAAQPTTRSKLQQQESNQFFTPNDLRRLTTFQFVSFRRNVYLRANHLRLYCCKCPVENSGVFKLQPVKILKFKGLRLTFESRPN